MKTLFLFALFSFFSFHAFAENLFSIKEGYIESDGAKIYYKRMGKGDPILLIHGGPGQNHTFFLPQFEMLAKNHELIFYDQRGSGNSSEDLDPEKINFYQFVDDLNALRKGLDLKNFTLLAHSWGAALAYQYAYENPELISKLILLNPIPASSQDFLSFAAKAEPILKKSEELLSELKESDAFLNGDIEVIDKFYRNLFKEFFFDQSKISEFHFHLNEKYAFQDFLVYKIFEETFYKNSYDFKPMLKEIKIPTLVVYASNDLIPEWVTQEIVKCLPNASYITLKGCGHFSYIEKPKELFKEINTFLNSISYNFIDGIIEKPKR